MRRSTLAGLTAGMIAVSGVPLLAQEEAPPEPPTEHRHRGFWLSGGLGPGVDDDGDAGFAAYIRLGGTPGRRVLLGGELIGMVRDEDDVTVSRGNAAFAVLFYPSRSGGLFLKGAVGLATIEAETEVEDDATLSISDEGVGAGIGVGGDIRLGGNLYLTPNADLVLQSFDGLESVDALFLFTVGVGMH